MTPLPRGFRLRPDRGARRYDGDRVLVGGHPRRVLRLSDRGAAAARRLLEGAAVCNDVDAALARRLVDAGLAHPVPPPASVSVAVVVPAYADADALDRCLAALVECDVVVVDDGSPDAQAMRDVAARHGATLHRLARNSGPGAARNAGAPLVDADVIAFVDSDAIATAETLQQLARHFADPAVAAVAPRVRPLDDGAAPAALTAFAAAMSPLDIGPDSAAVAPGRLLSYVPSTVLLVRRSAFDAIGGFDAALRFGEDVDLVWRLHGEGHVVRYVADVKVGHREPVTWQRWLARRFRYGTSAAALARRHTAEPLTLRLPVAPAFTLTLAAAGHRRAAVAATITTAALVARRLRALDVPPAPTVSPALAAPALAAPALAGVAAARWSTQLWWPILITAAGSRRHRAVAATALLAPPLVSWATRRPALDPLRWTLACWADDVVYGAGVWRGCLRERTFAPVVPVVTKEAVTSSR